MSNNLKNIVILKNLPSNIIEEAIIIIKENKMAKKLEYIDKKNEHKTGNKKNTKEYIIREAETVVSNYISKMEDEKYKKLGTDLNKKYKRLKVLSLILGLITIISLLVK